jgi:hypothetical protein
MREQNIDERPESGDPVFAEALGVSFGKTDFQIFSTITP